MVIFVARKRIRPPIGSRTTLRFLALAFSLDSGRGFGIAGFPEIIDGLAKAVCQAFSAVSFTESPPIRRNIEGRPMMEKFQRRIRIVRHKKEAARPLWDAGPSEWG